MFDRIRLLATVLAIAALMAGCSNYVQQAKVYESMGDYSSAIAAYERMAERCQGRERGYALANLGRLRLKLGQNWEAEKLLREAKKLLDESDPLYPEVCFNLGYCYYSRGAQWYGQAVEQMTEAVRLKEDYPKAHFYLGAIYLRTKQYRKALSHLRRVRGEHEDRASFMAGLCSWKLGDYEGAERMLRRAVELAETPEDKSEYLSALQELMDEVARREREMSKIAKVDLDPLFAALPAYYAENPIGQVTVVNRLEEAMEDVKLMVELKGISPAPAVNEVGTIAPGERKVVPIKAAMSPEKLRGLLEDVPSQEVIITLEYRVGNAKSYERKVAYTRLYNVHAVSWSPPEQIAAFVTHQNPTVMRVAKHASLADTPLEKAIQVYETLSLYGIVYSPDPKNPFSRKIDYVLYPWETLKQRGGDCDDLAVLYAACLESIGIQTAFLVSEDHIFVMFNSRLPEQKAKRVIPDAKLFVVREDGFAWIPVEVTMLGKGEFFEAWRKGAEEFSEELTAIPVEEAWERFKPVWVGEDLEIELPDRDKVLSMYNAEIRKAKEHWREIFGREIEYQMARLEKGEGSEAAIRNLIGINYAMMGEYEKAREQFQRAALLEPSVTDYHNNLANVLLILGDYEGAMREYEEAIKCGSRLGAVYFNMMICHFAAGQPEKGLEVMRTAMGRPEARDQFVAIARVHSTGAEMPDAFVRPEMVAGGAGVDKAKLQKLFGFGEAGTKASGISNPEELEWTLYWMR